MQKFFEVTLRDGILFRTRKISFSSRTQEEGIERLRREGTIGAHEHVVGSIATIDLAGAVSEQKSPWGRSVLLPIYNAWKAEKGMLASLRRRFTAGGAP